MKKIKFKIHLKACICFLYQINLLHKSRYYKTRGVKISRKSKATIQLALTEQIKQRTRSEIPLNRSQNQQEARNRQANRFEKAATISTNLHHWGWIYPELIGEKFRLNKFALSPKALLPFVLPLAFQLRRFADSTPRKANRPIFLHFSAFAPRENSPTCSLDCGNRG